MEEVVEDLPFDLTPDGREFWNALVQNAYSNLPDSALADQVIGEYKRIFSKYYLGVPMGSGRMAFVLYNEGMGVYPGKYRKWQATETKLKLDWGKRRATSRALPRGVDGDATILFQKFRSALRATLNDPQFENIMDSFWRNWDHDATKNNVLSSDLVLKAINKASDQDMMYNEEEYGTTIKALRAMGIMVKEPSLPPGYLISGSVPEIPPAEGPISPRRVRPRVKTAPPSAVPPPPPTGPISARRRVPRARPVIKAKGKKKPRKKSKGYNNLSRKQLSLMRKNTGANYNKLRDEWLAYRDANSSRYTIAELDRLFAGWATGDVLSQYRSTTKPGGSKMPKSSLPKKVTAAKKVPVARRTRAKKAPVARRTRIKKTTTKRTPGKRKKPKKMSKGYSNLSRRQFAFLRKKIKTKSALNTARKSWMAYRDQNSSSYTIAELDQLFRNWAAASAAGALGPYAQSTVSGGRVLRRGEPRKPWSGGKAVSSLSVPGKTAVFKSHKEAYQYLRAAKTGIGLPKWKKQYLSDAGYPRKGKTPKLDAPLDRYGKPRIRGLGAGDYFYYSLSGNPSRVYYI